MGINKEFPDSFFSPLEYEKKEKTSGPNSKLSPLPIEENILSSSSSSSSSHLDPIRVKIVDCEENKASVPDALEDDFGESLDLFLKEHLLEIPSDNPFFDTDVLVCKDYQGILPSNGMTVAEFEEAADWLKQLRAKQSAGSLKVEGDEPFSNAIYDSIKTLCQRRVGRELLRKLIEFEKETKIIQLTISSTDVEFAYADTISGTIEISVDSEYLATSYVQGQKSKHGRPSQPSIKDLASLEESSLFIALAHEMVHILHSHLSDDDLVMRMTQKLDSDFYVDQFSYHNMEEFLTITGWSDLSLDKFKKNQTWEEAINEENANAEDWDLEDDKKQSSGLENDEKWNHINENAIRSSYSQKQRFGHGGMVAAENSTKIRAFLDTAKAGRIEEMEQMWEELSNLSDPRLLLEVGTMVSSFSRDDVFEKVCDLIAAKDVRLVPFLLDSAFKLRTPSAFTTHLIFKYCECIQSKFFLNQRDLFRTGSKPSELVASILKVAAKYCPLEDFKEALSEKLNLKSLMDRHLIDKEKIHKIFLDSLFNNSIEVSKFFEKNYIADSTHIPFFEAYQICIKCNSVEKTKYVGDLSKGTFDPYLIRELCIESTKAGRKDKFLRLYPSIIASCRFTLENCPRILKNFINDGTAPFPFSFFPLREITEEDFPEFTKKYLSEENPLGSEEEKIVIEQYLNNEKTAKIAEKKLVDDYAIDFSPFKILSDLASAQKTPVHTLISLFFFLKDEKDFAREFINLASCPNDTEKVVAYGLLLDSFEEENLDLRNFILDNNIIELPNEEQKKVIQAIRFSEYSFSELAKMLQQEHASMIEPYLSGVSLLSFLGERRLGVSDNELSSVLLKIYQNLANDQEKCSDFWTIVRSNPDFFKESALDLLEEKIKHL